jgi:putative acetyltransferase
MISTRITIREEVAQDLTAIYEVEEQAFGQSDEADLVDALRQRGAVILSLVALLDGQVVGHILFTPVSIKYVVGAYSAIGLGPVAVSPL